MYSVRIWEHSTPGNPLLPPDAKPLPARKEDLTFARQVREYEPGDLRGEGHLPVAGECRSGRSKYYDGTGHCGALT